MAVADHIEYLGADQNSILGQSYSVTSCTTVALHNAMFLAYNDDPAPTIKGLLIQWLGYASNVWVDRYKEHKGSYESPHVVHSRCEKPKACMEPLQSLDIIGMSVLRRVAPPSSSDWLTYGVKNALDKLDKELKESHTIHSFPCVFVSRGFSIAVVLKTDATRTMTRIDVVDSHRRNLILKPPPREFPSGSAVWGRFHSTDAAARMIEAIFPPRETDEDLKKYDHIKQDKDKDNRIDGETEQEFLARSEREKIPEGFFDIHVYRPVCKTREAAESAIAGS